MKFARSLFAKEKLPRLALLLIAIAGCWHLFANRLSGDSWKEVIKSDGAGYYAYLPATFIFHDLKFGFTERSDPKFMEYPGRDIRQFGMNNAAGARINKYFIGTAIMQLPFFLAARAFDNNGYSYPFQAAVAIAGLFYLLAGLWCVRGLLQRLGVPDAIIALTLLLLFFGTNLCYYSLQEPSMSHVYSFAAISFFLWYGSKAVFSRGQVMLLSATLALIVLIRPPNAIILFALPLVWSNGSAAVFKSALADWKRSLPAAFLFFAMIFLQSVAWRAGTGNWYDYGYGSEKLDLLRPHLWDVLFSWRKGFFIYTPLLFIAAAGLFFMEPRKRAIGFAVFLFAHAWIVSSWSTWAYGGSFGMRPMIDAYALYAVPLSFLLANIGRKLFVPAAALACCLVFLNLFQHYQYSLTIIPYDGMSWEKYKRIFLVSEPSFAGIFSPDTESAGKLPAGAAKLVSFRRDFETDKEFPNRNGITNDILYTSAPCAVRLDGFVKMSPDLYVSLRDIPVTPPGYRLWVQGSVSTWAEDDVTDAKFIFSFKNGDTAYSWNSFYIAHKLTAQETWERYSYAMEVPPGKGAGDQLSVYVLKDDDTGFFLDDLELTFWAIPQAK
jgi:hypothetical protein